MTWLFAVSVVCVIGAVLVPVIASLVNAGRGPRH